MAPSKAKEKIKSIISNKPPQWLNDAQWFEQNETWLNKSALIALKILRALRAENISQQQLAETIGVSPQYINKVVKGSENLTLSTVCKIEKALGITLIAVNTYESSQMIIESHRAQTGQYVMQTLPTLKIKVDVHEYNDYQSVPNQMAAA